MAISLADETYDFAIVGQGLAGTLLDFELQKLGCKTVVIDNAHYDAASKVAAGIINPITGRNFVLSWRFMDFYKVALVTYEALGEKLGQPFFIKQDILRALDGIESENQWIGKSADDVIGQFIQHPSDITSLGYHIKEVASIAHIVGAGRVDLPCLISAYHQLLVSEGRQVSAYFNINLLKMNQNILQYDDIKCKELVLCQGAQAKNDNPYFGDIRLSATKGQVLIIKCAGLDLEVMFKNKFFIIPLGADLFWVGAGYEWNANDSTPTEKGREEILSHLLAMADMPPYEIIDHLAALRPTVHTRRPIIKTSGIDDRIHIFNGLGTKGASIGPYVARQFARYLVHKDASDLIL